MVNIIRPLPKLVVTFSDTGEKILTIDRRLPYIEGGPDDPNVKKEIKKDYNHTEPA